MLTYSQVTLQDLRNRFGITVRQGHFLPSITPLPQPDWLREYFGITSGIPATFKSEKAVSESIIAPVIFAVKERNKNKIGVFSGEPLSSGELAGICDFIISSDPDSYLPEPPLIVLIEAKRQDLNTGIPQCAAEMVTAKKINENAGLNYESVFGCVTTGTEWLFLQLMDDKNIIAHNRIFFLPELEEILGVFQWMINYFHKDIPK